jgi:phosphatidate cytidylyltransferase
MNEILKRAIFGGIYVAVLWTCTIMSSISFAILFFILGIISLYEMWKLRKGKSKMVAFAYIITPFILIQLIPYSGIGFSIKPFDPSIILLLFILTWTFDTFAFIVGVKFGKNKILPSVSPKKSWEGFVGGLIFCVLIGFIAHNFFSEFFNIKIKTIITFSIMLPITATLGDFIESHFKRQAEVKDSGNIIPGHGGILDRMDAFMITIPVLYIIINII